MTKRKLRLADPEAFDQQAALLRVVERFDDVVLASGLNALLYGQGSRAFQRAMESLETGDEEAIDRIDVAVYCNFRPDVQLRELPYGSVQEHTNVEVKRGKGGVNYLKAKV